MDTPMITFRDKKQVSPSDVHDRDAFAIKVVAVAGRNNDWAAYTGPSHWEDVLVADSGDKLDVHTARSLFYVLTMSCRTYRQ